MIQEKETHKSQADDVNVTHHNFDLESSEQPKPKKKSKTELGLEGD